MYAYESKTAARAIETPRVETVAEKKGGNFGDTRAEPSEVSKKTSREGPTREL